LSAPPDQGEKVAIMEGKKGRGRKERKKGRKQGELHTCKSFQKAATMSPATCSSNIQANISTSS